VVEIPVCFCSAVGLKRLKENPIPGENREPDFFLLGPTIKSGEISFSKSRLFPIFNRFLIRQNQNRYLFTSTF
jgi:hypothetical protein